MNLDQIYRLSIIDSTIKYSNEPTRQKIMERIDSKLFGVITGAQKISNSCFEKDMQLLKHTFNAPIKCRKPDKKQPFYEYNEKYDFWKQISEVVFLHTDIPKDLFEKIYS